MSEQYNCDCGAKHLDPMPWISSNDLRGARELFASDRFKPRPEYSQNREDYDQC